MSETKATKTQDQCACGEYIGQGAEELRAGLWICANCRGVVSGVRRTYGPPEQNAWSIQDKGLRALQESGILGQYVR